MVVLPNIYCIEYKTMIEAHLPKRLKRVSVFDDFNERPLLHCYKESGLLM